MLMNKRRLCLRIICIRSKHRFAPALPSAWDTHTVMNLINLQCLCHQSHPQLGPPPRPPPWPGGISQALPVSVHSLTRKLSCTYEQPSLPLRRRTTTECHLNAASSSLSPSADDLHCLAIRKQQYLHFRTILQTFCPKGRKVIDSFQILDILSWCR